MARTTADKVLAIYALVMLAFGAGEYDAGMVDDFLDVNGQPLQVMRPCTSARKMSIIFLKKSVIINIIIIKFSQRSEQV